MNFSCQNLIARPVTNRRFPATATGLVWTGLAALLVFVGLQMSLAIPAHAQSKAPAQKPLDRKLIAAINARDTAAVQRLLQAGADINTVGAVGDGKGEFFAGNEIPALVIGVLAGGPPTLEALVRYGGSGWRKNADAAFFIAAGWGNPDAVRLFLDNGVRADTVVGGSPILATVASASYPGAEKVVTLLLDRGAPIDAAVQDVQGTLKPSSNELAPNAPEPDEIGRTALMQAAANGGLEVTRLLLARGASFRLRDAAGSTALDLAREAKRDEIAALLERAESHQEDAGSRRELVQAVAASDAAALQSLLQAKGDPDARNDAGEPLIVVAARANKAALVEILLQHGARIDLPDLKDHYTALIRAAEAGYADVVRLLISHHADLEAHLRYYPWTPLTSAALYDHLPVVQALVEAGVDVNARDDRKTTPLMEAANYGKTDIVRYLLAHRARLRDVDVEGLSALAMARRNGFRETARVLAAASAKH